jgi:hypothetical protein
MDGPADVLLISVNLEVGVNPAIRSFLAKLMKFCFRHVRKIEIEKVFSAISRVLWRDILCSGTLIVIDFEIRMSRTVMPTPASRKSRDGLKCQY